MEPSAYGHSVDTFRQVGCRGAIARLHVPLSTLHERPHGRPHMTRGRCDWRGLHRTTLACVPPHRFIPALLPLRHRPLEDGACAMIPKSLRHRGEGSPSPMGKRVTVPVCDGSPYAWALVEDAPGLGPYV